MKIRRFSGTDMRDAMQKVSKALGPDSVILESSKIDEGVTISAAIDFDPVAYRRSRAETEDDTHIDLLDTDDEPVTTDSEISNTRAKEIVSSKDFVTMQREVKSIRCLLEAQLSRLIWDERERKTPELASTMRNLSKLGLAPDIVNRLVSELSDTEIVDTSWSTALRQLVNNIPVIKMDTVLEGGVFAIVGPTGVGKTTSIAKLAARYAMSHGASEIALLTVDTFKIGAREQLETFGQILDIPVYQACDTRELIETLTGLADKKLVLIDTAGMSQRDVKLDTQIRLLRDADTPIDVLLALPANMQTDTLQEVVTSLKAAEPTGCILTKIDEATSLGGPLSVLMREQLTLAYIANGQRVPEDLHCAHARQAWLVKAAVELIRSDEADASDEYMAQHFGEVA